jgi:arylsulfatase A
MIIAWWKSDFLSASRKASTSPKSDFLSVKRRIMKRRESLKVVFAGAAAFALLGCIFPGLFRDSEQVAFGNNPTGTPPNFILILSDDHGWTGTSVAMDPGDPASRSDFIETPNLERLAKRGMRFSNAYSPAAMCSPTRCAIQYGKSPTRLMHTDNYVRYPEAKERISASLSLPRMLKQTGLGYVTAHIGKWHQWPHPDEVGYDVNTGATDNPEGNFLKRGDRKTKTKPIPLPADDPKRIFSLSRKACEFLDEQVKADKPFYLQISHYAVHKKLLALAETQAKYEKKKRGKWHYRPEFGACTEDLDTGIGIVLDKLKDLGIEDNTYVFFMADNGAVAINEKSHDVNMPLRRGKFIFMEGGIRVPMLAAGPGIPKNTHSDALVWGCDLWPTIHELVGAKTPLPKNLDGGSLEPLFKTGGEGEVTRAGMPEGLIFHCPAGQNWSGTRRQSAIRSGAFKLMKNYYSDGEVLLFNVKDDPYEWHDLSKELPQKRDELLKKMEGYLEKVQAADAHMTPEQIADMQNAKQLATERRDGWRGYSKPSQPTEYPVDSFSEREKDLKPYGE